MNKWEFKAAYSFEHRQEHGHAVYVCNRKDKDNKTINEIYRVETITEAIDNQLSNKLQNDPLHEISRNFDNCFWLV